MTIYLTDRGKPINGLQIKERYGKDFEAQKKFQNIPRFVVYRGTEGQAEFYRLSSAKKFCEKL